MRIVFIVGYIIGLFYLGILIVESFRKGMGCPACKAPLGSKHSSICPLEYGDGTR